MTRLWKLFKSIFDSRKCLRCRRALPKNNVLEGLCLDCYHEAVIKYY